MSELPSTENLRQFYHVHLALRWSETISYMEMVRLYHRTQAHSVHFSWGEGEDEREVWEFYKHLLRKDIDLHLLERQP